jgi:hypothetical protein
LPTAGRGIAIGRPPGGAMAPLKSDPQARLHLIALKCSRMN